MIAVLPAGSPPSPIPPGWISIAAWPKRPHAVRHPRVSISEALSRRWPSDAHAQLLTDTSPGAAELGGYRYSAELLDHPHAAHVHLVAAVADLDRPGHAPWPSRLDATLAVLALRAAYPQATIYSTRAGVRLWWSLAHPVPVAHARWWLRAWHAHARTLLPEGLDLVWDGSADEWTRHFRLPYVVRDGVPSDPYVSGLDAPPLDWTPPGPPEVESRAPAAGVVPPIGDAPADVPPPPSEWRAWISHSSAAGRVLDLLTDGRPWGPPEVPAGTRNSALKVAVNSVCYQYRRGGPAPTPLELFSIFWPSVSAELARDPSADGAAVLWRFCSTSSSAEGLRRAAHVAAIHPVDTLPPLVTHGDGVGYVLRGDAYVGPLRGSEIYVALRDHQPGAVPITRPSGRQLRTIPELLVSAAAADSVELYYPSPGAPPAAWVPERRALRVRTIRPSTVEPTESAPVADWLDALLSRASDVVRSRVLDWLATATRLDRVTSALYLQGPAGAGKGLLASGVAALWHAAPLAFREATGQFTEGLLRSPVVLLDEGVVVDRSVSAAFRSLVGQTTHRVEAKNRPLVTLHGAPRVIIAANNSTALDLRGQHEADDLDAVAQRILHVEVADAGGDLLRDLGGREGALASWLTRPDGTPGDLPRHLAWLAATREVAPGPRFLVPGVPTVYHLRLLTGDPLFAGALIAIAAALGGPDPGGPGVFCRAGEGVVWVNPMRLHRRWQALVAEDVPRPTVQRVAGALAALARASSATLFEGVDGGSAACWPIGEDLVLRVATDLGYPDPHRVRAAFVLGTRGAPGGPGSVPSTSDGVVRISGPT